MKPSNLKLTLALLATLLLAPLAALQVGRNLTEAPSFGKLRISSFQPLGNCGVLTSNDWDCRIR